jgi:pimeloyl-ACP methyl ester carboxylesterase
LEPFLKDIKSQTLIIWGKEDKLTPFWQAKIISQKIRKNKLKSFPNTGHDVPFSKYKQVAEEIREFLKK